MVRVVDTAIQHHNCSSLPLRSLSRSNFSDTYDDYTDPYQAGLRAYGNWKALSFEHIVFVNCKHSVRGHGKYVETEKCVKWDSKGYAYAVGGDLKAEDFEVGCDVKLVAPTSLWTFNNHSYASMHKALAYGFEISWLTLVCQKNPCLEVMCYFDYAIQNRCRRGELDRNQMLRNDYISYRGNEGDRGEHSRDGQGLVRKLGFLRLESSSVRVRIQVWSVIAIEGSSTLWLENAIGDSHSSLERQPSADDNLEYAIVQVNAELGHGGGLSEEEGGNGGEGKADLGGDAEADLGAAVGEDEGGNLGDDEADLGAAVGEDEGQVGGEAKDENRGEDEADLGGEAEAEVGGATGLDEGGNGGEAEAEVGGAAGLDEDGNGGEVEAEVGGAVGLDEDGNGGEVEVDLGGEAEGNLGGAAGLDEVDIEAEVHSWDESDTEDEKFVDIPVNIMGDRNTSDNDVGCIAVEAEIADSKTTNLNNFCCALIRPT
ncbi:hypothetical protein DEO72_LG7g617 [Vigna unguiculata]|uniref:Uncharacterized protein n=1 Tax=Vigna unguiculata TaxID=3917 RepID=A0A4D6MH72_VIGUN|nr:hypothetical protein DEO72_LG7g617 [Vigna unguiculata]